MDTLHWIDAIAAALPAPVAGLLAGGFAQFESGLGLGFALPGETVLLILAATMPTSPAVLGLVLAVVIAASAGDHIGYLVGRRFRPRMLGTSVIRRVGGANWDRAVAVVERRGAVAVLLASLVPVVRRLAPAVAGVAGLPYRRFLLASLAGAAARSAITIGAGLALRAWWEAAGALLGQDAPWALLTAVLVITTALGVCAILRKQGHHASAPGESASSGWALGEWALGDSAPGGRALHEPAAGESVLDESRQRQTTP